eukprot:9391818-Karenia_brevis.AAC.1
MANPKVVSWRALKKVARYLVGGESVVWKYGWQDEWLVGKHERQKVDIRRSMDAGKSLHQNFECLPRSFCIE